MKFDADATGRFANLLPSLSRARANYVNAQRELTEKLKTVDFDLHKELCKFAKDCDAGAGKVLVLDDDVFVSRALSKLLHTNGYDVTVASTPDQAKKLLHETLYEVVLLDLFLEADESGLDVAREVPRCSRLYLITGRTSDEEMAKMAKHCGATGYFIKPWENDKFLAAIGVPSRAVRQ